ncbi:MAG TPA: 16S rRNA (cytidine(1402)-2'-O)-methyltransferase [Armatimonadota bacterium]|nr:16S rRNA (cytidine(1402)-2'-O)-methyltransferase [Armatimonadota bacterium]
MAGTLFLVATPIGNLEDITLRALRTLREVSLIAAEDTRHTRHLLNHYEITTRAISYHDHSPPEREDALLRHLADGQDIALVTDAGAPGVSDPGFRLVVRAIRAGFSIVPIPGPSAVITALSASGLPPGRFVFEGFLPRKKSERLAALARLSAEPRTIVLFEAPLRIPQVLRELEDALGPRPITIARELTKLYEEIWRGNLKEARDRWPKAGRGEFTLVVGGAPTGSEQSENRARGSTAAFDRLSSGAGVDQLDVEALLAALLDQGLSRRDAARQLSKACGLPYRDAYRRAMDRKSGNRRGAAANGVVE